VRKVFKALDKDPPQLRELDTYYPQTLFPTGFWAVEWDEAFQGIPLGRGQYYLRCLERYDIEQLLAPPRLRFDTIHGVKGLEADHVFLLTDVSRRTYDTMLANPDVEHRVWYVALTRARQTLQLVAPQSDIAYSL
jgi:hypothetical protein